MKSRLMGKSFKMLMMSTLMFLFIFAPSCREGSEEVFIYSDTYYYESYSTTEELVVSFSSEILSLSDYDAMTNEIEQKIKLTVDPPAEGSWRPIGTTSAAFEFTEPLMLSTEYTVEINSDQITDLDGDKVDTYINYQKVKNGTFTFQTTRIKVNSIYAVNEYTNTPIYINFNLPVLISEVEKKVMIEKGSGKDVDFTAGYSIITNSFESNGIMVHSLTTNRKKVYLYPEYLEKATTYKVTVPQGFFAVQGNMGTKSKYEKSFSTYMPLKYEEFYSSDYNYSTGYHWYSDTTWIFEFNNDLDIRVPLTNLITVTPEVENLDVSYGSKYVYLDGNFIGGEEYTVTIATGLKDIYDQVYEDEISETVVIEHSLSHFSVESGYIVMENYLEPILPFKVRNIEHIEFQYAWADTVDEIVQYLNPKGSFYKDPFEENMQTKDITIEWDWDVYFNYRLAMSKMKGADSGVLMYVATPDLIKTESSSADQTKRGMILFTDIGVTVKSSPFTTLVFVRNLKDNTPVENAKIYHVVLSKNGNSTVYLGETDEDGFLEIGRNPSYDIPIILAEKDGDFGMNYGTDYSYYYGNYYYNHYDMDDYWTYTSGANIIDYGYEYYYDQPKSFAFTERYLYNPGDDVEVKVMVRYRNEDAWTTIPNADTDYYISVYNSRGESITNLNLSPDDWGSMQFTVHTDEDGPTGYYYMYIDSDDDYKYLSFRVEEFEPAEAEMQIYPDKTTYVWSDDFTADVIGWYLFGAPVIKPYTVSAYVSPMKYYNSTYSDYSFNPKVYDDESDHKDAYFSLLSETYFPDEDGVAEIVEKLKNDDFYGDGSITLSAYTTLDDDSTVYGVDSSMEVINPIHVGVDVDGYFVKTDKPFDVSIIALDENEEVAKKVSATLEIEKREWNSVQKAGVNGELEWESTLETTSVFKETYKIGEKTISMEMDEPGYYIARVSTFVRGHKMVAETSFYCIGSGSYGWKIGNDYGLDLESDQEEYSVGDTAQILVMNPFEDADALVTIEREKFHDVQWYVISNSVAVIPVEITEDYIPNIDVSVMLFTGRSGYDNVEDDQDLSRPTYRIGTISLDVDTAEKELDVNLTTDREDYEPGEEVSLTVDVKNYLGNSVESEVTIAAVDKGVLNLVAYEFPDAISTFYADRWSTIYTSDMREFIFGQRYLAEKGEVVGGDGGASEGMISPRQDFKATPFYNAKVITSNAKPVTLSFTLPDNITSFKIMASAQTKDSRFGYGNTIITVSKPLMVMEEMPSFLRLGDEIEAGGIIHNYTGEDQTVTVTMTADNDAIDFKSATTTNVFIENNGSEEVRFKFEVDMTYDEEIEFVLSAKAGKNTDAVLETLSIEDPKLYEVTGLYDKTTDSVSQQVNVTEAVIPELSKIELTVSPSAFTELKGSVDYLIEYPYGCLEQKMSSILPLVLGEDIIIAHELLEEKTADDLRELVQTILDEVDKYKGSKGFKYWSSSSYISPYMTVYTTFILTKAKEAGYDIDQDLYDDAVEWVTDYAEDRGYWPYEWWDYSDYYKALVRNFALYVASLNDYQSVAALKRRFLELKDELNDVTIAHAFLLKTAAAYDSFDDQEYYVEELSSVLFQRSMTESETVYFKSVSDWGWFYYDNVISTAIILQAIIEADVDFDYSHKVINWLITARKAGIWETTHQNAMVFWAFSTYLNKFEKEEPDFKATVNINEETLLSEMFKSRTAPSVTKTHQLSADDSGILDVDISKTGTGMLYYFLRYRYILKNYPTIRDAGFEISKNIYDYDTGEEITDSTFIRGQRYVVTMKINTPKDRYFVVLDDQLPAGFEPVNLDFATEESESGFITTGSGYRWWTWGTFDNNEKYFDRVIFTADYMRSGDHYIQYVVRATTLGTFQVPQTKAEEMYQPEVFGYIYQPDVTVIEADD